MFFNGKISHFLVWKSTGDNRDCGNIHFLEERKSTTIIDKEKQILTIRQVLSNSLLIRACGFFFFRGIMLCVLLLNKNGHITALNRWTVLIHCLQFTFLLGWKHNTFIYCNHSRDSYFSKFNLTNWIFMTIKCSEVPGSLVQALLWKTKRYKNSFFHREFLSACKIFKNPSNFERKKKSSAQLMPMILRWQQYEARFTTAQLIQLFSCQWYRH